jgi:hypothetical protein
VGPLEQHQTEAQRQLLEARNWLTKEDICYLFSAQECDRFNIEPPNVADFVGLVNMIFLCAFLKDQETNHSHHFTAVEEVAIMHMNTAVFLTDNPIEKEHPSPSLHQLLKYDFSFYLV